MLDDEAIQLLLKDLLEVYGYDFTFYSKESLRRRINKLFKIEKIHSLNELQYKLKNEPFYLEHLVNRITVSVTEMFRDPHLYLEIIQKVFPSLKNRNRIHIWHAGCSSGEEVYSMAILLKEAGLLERSVLYGTDFNRRVLEKAKLGRYPHSLLKLYRNKYLAAGGKYSLMDYYAETPEGGTFHAFLKEHLRFSEHNLSSDPVMQHMDIVICRNVLIYFDRELQEKVLLDFDKCLKPLSYLVLGEKENMVLSSIRSKYSMPGKEKIWIKME